jgi:hypothetical protein
MVDFTDGIADGTDGITDGFNVRACPPLSAPGGSFPALNAAKRQIVSTLGSRCPGRTVTS